MSFKLVLQSEAVVEIQEAFEWYETQFAGLGYQLLEELETGYKKISGSLTTT